METLVDNIRKIEQEVEDRLEKVEADGKDNLQDLLAAEVKIMEDIRHKAELTGQAIVKESIAKAQNETNQMKQSEEKAVAAVHSSAKNNAERAAMIATELFNSEYLS